MSILSSKLEGWLTTSQSLTQEKIGERIGWSRKEVADYNRVIEGIVPDILKIILEHQQGRGTANVPSGTTFNFTEGWFRDSGELGNLTILL